ncbi:MULTISPECIES: hypothetical protein [unclassified Olleya]|jgi:uncharacterized integral membrane protein|uniref:hypothetical protein n=1 Tax=unclassified Olleya TaxID=2615019 RepID=UPI0011A8607A|nr:hypothetical protein [Olleya sp. Hel_I_94]TVZ48106.1 hypothetical protein JM82_2737 [Olleya sp. Hel_I_94]
MSENNKEIKSNNEEEDLVVFFNLIGNAFNKLLNNIFRILKYIFSVLIFTLRFFITKWKIILGIVLLAAVIGYALEKTKPTAFQAEMLVEPYFNSKFQLVNNIDYFNALIASGDTQSLQKIFKIDKETVSAINGFSIEPGPETENDKLLQYENFIAQLDSVRAQEYSYEDFISNRSEYAGKFFLIKAYASRANVFKDLEDGILTSFVNNYSNKAMKRRDDLINIQKENLEDQLQQVKDLQNIYINVIERESNNKEKSFKIGDISISGSDGQKTREYELLQEEQRIRNELKKLEEQKIEEDVVFEVISSFQEVGNISSHWKEKYSIIFPILSLVILILFFMIRKIIVYTLNYEE